MKKAKNIVDPFELRAFLESQGHDHRHACTMTSYITPECEVHTRDFSLKDTEVDLQLAREEGDAFEVQVHEGVLAFMKANDVTSFTLTQG